MNWKMAENSLFAVLLRSPWWISFVLAAAMSLVARALMPDHLAAVATVAGLPFVVVGLLAVRKQWRLPSANLIDKTLSEASALSWKDFSDRLEAGWRKEGFSVERLQDGAADFRLRKEGQTTLVAARRWKAGNHGVESLRALSQARTHEDARHASYIALALLPQPSVVFAKQHGVDLPDAVRLTRWLAG
jgi:restriction system protein